MRVMSSSLNLQMGSDSLTSCMGVLYILAFSAFFSFFDGDECELSLSLSQSTSCAISCLALLMISFLMNLMGLLMMMSQFFLLFSSISSIVLYPPLVRPPWLCSQACESGKALGTSSYLPYNAFIFLSLLGLISASAVSGRRYSPSFFTSTVFFQAYAVIFSLSCRSFNSLMVSSELSKISFQSLRTALTFIRVSFSLLSRYFMRDCCLSSGMMRSFSSSVRVTACMFCLVTFPRVVLSFSASRRDNQSRSSASRLRTISASLTSPTSLSPMKAFLPPERSISTSEYQAFFLTSALVLRQLAVRDPKRSKRDAAKNWLRGLSLVGMSKSARDFSSCARVVALVAMDLMYSTVPLSFSPIIQRHWSASHFSFSPIFIRGDYRSYHPKYPTIHLANYPIYPSTSLYHRLSYIAQNFLSFITLSVIYFYFQLMYDHVFLTGFKKFGHHALNPTEEVVNAIAHPSVTCSILQVTTVAVDQYIQKIRAEVSARQGQRILHLHFGVGPNPVYFAENFAYNNKTFSIPDNAGYQPIKEKINEEAEFDQPLKTQVDLVALLEGAVKEGFQWQHSSNPGRYLCNYIYFRSLRQLGKWEGNHSLFIHFPTHALSPHQKNVVFVQYLLGVLLPKKGNLTVENQ